MITVTEKSPPKRRRFFSGYRAEIVVQRLFEPLATTMVVTLQDTQSLPAIMSLVQQRENLWDAWRREEDQSQSLRLFERMSQNSSEIRNRGAHVRRKIFWF